MIDNYKDFVKFLDTINYRPKLLLHSCCAPCSTWVIEMLNKYFDITILYSNDNIYPKEEFDKRLNEQIRYTKDLNINVMFDYNDKDFYQAIKGYEDCLEGEERCFYCYKLRLEKTALKASLLNFDYFTTTLSISPYKNSKWINKIGEELSLKYNINFLYSDFKKQEGYKKSIVKAKEKNLYRQDYCGCIFSYKARGEHL